MKKFLFMLVTVCTICYHQSVTVQAKDTVDGFEYSVVKEGVMITEYQGEEKKVTIPETVAGYTVIGIGEEAFLGNCNIETVYMPDTITTIGKKAFADCSGLTYIDLSDGLKEMKERAFENCYKLMGVKIPASIVSVGMEYDDYRDTYITPFYGCESLTGVTFKEGITKIPEYMFAGVESLESVNIPSTVTEIGSYAFAASGVNSITFKEGQLSTIQSYAFERCLLEKLELPDSVTFIGEYAFADCSSLNKLTLSASLKELQGAAFKGCTLEELEIPATLETAGTVWIDFGEYDAGPFLESSIEKLTFQDGMTKVPNHLFQKAAKIEKITMPDSVTTIGAYAFGGCRYLNDIILSKQLKTIENNAFEYGGYYKRIEIPDSVTSIGSYAFQECDELHTIVLSANLQEIQKGTFRYCTNLSKIEIPASLTKIEFNWNEELEINENPFYGCWNLQEVEFEEGLTNIPGNMFSNLSKLKYVTIPQSVTSIGEYAFADCPQLSSVTATSNLQNIGNYAFYNCGKLNSLTTMEGVKKIGDAAFYGCKTLVTTLPRLIVTIGEKAFYDCDALTETYFGANVTSVGKEAFANCDGLENITIGKDMTEICAGTFENCPKIDFVKIPDNITGIGDSAFAGCTGLKEVEIYQVDTYGSDIFSEPTELTIFGIGGSATESYANNIGATFVDIDYFNDVIASSHNWKYAPARYMFEMRYMTGKATDTNGKVRFDPDAYLTRAEFAQIIYSIEEKPTITYTERFKDVPQDKWFANSILWVAEQGIVSGYGDNYGPEDNITREQLVAILFKYAKSKGYDTSARADLSYFEDVTDIQSYAEPAIQWANANGIISGKGRIIDPAGNATRAECAAMVRKFVETFADN